jgi:transketolase C-terminal domain/subunit
MDGISDIIGTGGGRVDMKLIGNAPPGCHVLHDALSHGRAADIAVANEHDAMQIIIPLDAVFELSDITFQPICPPVR